MQLELIYRKMDLLLSGVDFYMFVYFAVTHTVLLADQVPAVSCCSGFRWWAMVPVCRTSFGKEKLLLLRLLLLK